MASDSDLTLLSCVEDVENHIFELYSLSSFSTNQDLGFISKTQHPLQISVKDEDFAIEQSPSLLTSNSISSTTGYVAWKVSPPFLEWLLYHRGQPFHNLLQRSDLQILELGSGSAGIVASCLAKRCKHFVASDQSSLIKLLKRNIINNVPSFDTNTIEGAARGERSRNKRSIIVDAIELDWEDPHCGIQQLQGWHFIPDLILACDTIYNEYLIPHFIKTLQMVSTSQTTILIAVHLRDFEVVEKFLKSCLESFVVRYVDEVYLTEAMQNGFAVYHLKRII